MNTGFSQLPAGLVGSCFILLPYLPFAPAYAP